MALIYFLPSKTIHCQSGSGWLLLPVCRRMGIGGMKMLSDTEIFKLDYIHELIDAMEDSVNSSYEILSNGIYEEPIKYQLSLSFLNVAETNYVNYLYTIREIRAERDETYSFETSYNEFKFQLQNYVLEKDTNPTWLSSRKETFIKKSDVLKEFIRDVISSYYENKRK